MSSLNLRLAWCNHKAARWACENWHYSKTVPVGRKASVGVWEDERFIGAVIFTLGAGMSTDGRRFGLARNFEVAELQRVALTNHKTTVSRILSIAVKLLRKKSPGLKLLISFADTREGHHGGIYQAAGWVYVGLTRPKKEFHHPDGRIFHDRSLTSSGVVMHFGRLCKNAVPFSEVRKVSIPGKHKYLLPLDNGVQPRIEALAKPYPKRPKDSSEPPVHHTGEGGAAPTRTLHTSR